MSCKNFEDLRRQIKEITGIEHDTFANLNDGVLRVHRDTYVRWAKENELGRNVGGEFEKIMESYGDFSKSFREAAEKNPKLRKNSVSEEQWNNIHEHYAHWNDWKKTHSAQLDRLATSSVMFKILRWQNRHAVPSPNPFYTKTIGREGSSECIPVHDEAVVYRSATLHTPVAGPLETEIRTSGDLLEPIRIWPRHPEPEQGDSILLNDLGGSRILDNLRGSLRLSFKMTEEDHEILYGARIFNGFQKGWEFASGKTFNNMISDRFFLIVDFSVVIDTTPFTRCPQAVHIDVEGKRTKIEHFRSPDAEVWYAKYENLCPGSRINLEWSMI